MTMRGRRAWVGLARVLKVGEDREEEVIREKDGLLGFHLAWTHCWAFNVKRKKKKIEWAGLGLDF